MIKSHKACYDNIIKLTRNHLWKLTRMSRRCRGTLCLTMKRLIIVFYEKESEKFIENSENFFLFTRQETEIHNIS